MLLRGLFYEGCRADERQVKDEKEDLVVRVWAEFPDVPSQEEIEAKITAVFSVLLKRITPGEIQDVQSALPPKIRELWPQLV